MRTDETFTDLYDGCYRRLVGELYVMLGSLPEARGSMQPGGHPVRLRADDEGTEWLTSPGTTFGTGSGRP
ncbi:MAG: hypothetical protein JWM93_3103 [Frankiales bacterium]|nr:hypothetical protein [Frankiales bacterium]